MFSSSITPYVKGKRFPAFITNSDAISSNIEINKVFPKIGLTNSKEDIKLNISFADLQLERIIHLAVRKFLDEWREHHRANTTLKGLELLKISNVLYIFEELSRRFSKKEGYTNINNQIILTKAIPSFDGKVLIKAGTNVFKLVQTLLMYGMKYVEVEMLEPSKLNDQLTNLKLVFSSDNLDGAWDIATMSMRGIKSCMRWEAKQSPALVGSIIDPCCAIIYITNGNKTAFGSKMLFRSVVRLAMHQDNSSQPILLVDRVYSSFYKTKQNEVGKFDNYIKKIFIDYIKSKVTGCRVIDAQTASQEKDTLGNHWLISNYVLPMIDTFDLLRSNEFSYRDTHLDYGDHLMSEKELSKVLFLVGGNQTKPKTKNKSSKSLVKILK